MCARVCWYVLVREWRNGGSPCVLEKLSARVVLLWICHRWLTVLGPSVSLQGSPSRRQWVGVSHLAAVVQVGVEPHFATSSRQEVHAAGGLQANMTSMVGCYLHQAKSLSVQVQGKDRALRRAKWSEKKRPEKRELRGKRGLMLGLNPHGPNRHLSPPGWHVRVVGGQPDVENKRTVGIPANTTGGLSRGGSRMRVPEVR